LTVDDSHSHGNSSIEPPVSTISTAIEEIELGERGDFLKGSKKQRVGGRRKSATWSRQEIATLITLLKEYGTDFSIIGSRMGKDRDQVKRKFKYL
jgi:hypothetical protein